MSVGSTDIRSTREEELWPIEFLLTLIHSCTRGIQFESLSYFLPAMVSVDAGKRGIRLASVTWPTDF